MKPKAKKSPIQQDLIREPDMHDLVVLTADVTMELTVRALLDERTGSLRIRELTSKVLRSPTKDSGFLKDARPILARFKNTHKYALCMLDYESSSASKHRPEELCENIRQTLHSDWDDRVRVIVIVPELETWVWSLSPHVARILGWESASPDLRTWLMEKGYLSSTDQIKPTPPKEAIEAALREIKRPWSSSIHQQLAQKVSWERCTDPAFLEFQSILRQWFPLPVTSTRA